MIRIRTRLHNEMRGGYDAYRVTASVTASNGQRVYGEGGWVGHGTPSIAIQEAYSAAIRALMCQIDITDGGR